MRTRLATTLALSAATTFAVAAFPAAAAPVDSGTFAFEDTYVFEDCGVPLESHEVISGRFTIKDAQPRTGGEFFRLMQQTEAHITVTDPASGAFFTIEWRTLFAESPGTAVPGSPNLFEYRTVEAGVWDLWRDSSGAVKHRSTGAISFRYLFDSLGDGAPGGQILDGQLLRASGNLPTFDADFCDLALPLLD